MGLGGVRKRGLRKFGNEEEGIDPEAPLLYPPYPPVSEAAMKPYEGKKLKVPKIEGVAEERIQTVIGTKILGDPKLRRPNMFDMSIMVPPIIRWRGFVPPNSVCDELVVSPTCLQPSWISCRDLPNNPRFEEKSLLPLLKGWRPAWRDAVYLLYDMHHSAVANMGMIRTKE